MKEVAGETLLKKFQHPILMSQPMMVANLAGLKSVTRRTSGLKEVNHEPELWKFVRFKNGIAVFYCANNVTEYVKCPYGEPGHRLWVRETFSPFGYLNGYAYAASPETWHDAAETRQELKWKPSIHMPRAASRMLLEVVSIGIERLEDITSAEVFKEGIRVSDDAGHIGYMNNPGIYLSRFKKLWDSLHKKTGWEKDKKKFVWRIEYKIIK